MIPIMARSDELLAGKTLSIKYMVIRGVGMINADESNNAIPLIIALT